jgi:hypothetical protein
MCAHFDLPLSSSFSLKFGKIAQISPLPDLGFPPRTLTVKHLHEIELSGAQRIRYFLFLPIFRRCASAATENNVYFIFRHFRFWEGSIAMAVAVHINSVLSIYTHTDVVICWAMLRFTHLFVYSAAMRLSVQYNGQLFDAYNVMLMI